jgi:transcriptional regulator with XRE-family HTH domain
MSDNSLVSNAGAKMLGVLMRDARLARGKTAADCAGAMARSPGDYEAFELGEASPSLPELELLAYSLDVPLAYFWRDRTRAAHGEPADRGPVPAGDLAALRHRIIGVLVRQARLAAGQTPESLAEAAGVSTGWLLEAELGQQAIPVQTLEQIAARLGVGPEYFLEAHGSVGEWESAERAAERVRSLPPELREFVSRPANEPYLNLALALSQVSNSRLRAIAEALLDISY